MRRAVMFAVVALAFAVGIARCRPCTSRSPAWRFATFNIEDYPKHPGQTDAAFAEIAKLDASVVAVQEITDPDRFARAASDKLGTSWRFVAVDTGPSPHYLGVLFDTRAWTHRATVRHVETMLEGRQKPTLEVQLEATDTRELVRVFVVHLKAGGDGRAIRARQYVALRTILAGDRARSIVLGDFNATDDRGDRADLAALARATHLDWATEDLACSAFWDRDDGCFRSRLDHALVWHAPLDVRARGACETEGCARQDRCPRYIDQVSDHCPVVVSVDP